ncbi:MAG: hypothetical protein COV72_02500 [Candidatus Omnitrophica bacterium CG11_big_fil_rev_8_21_14_0_20_42_13]|uniref:PepSY domain-containing protein n=1 Tax=Candidatus Ghiorseimicrobium undicola TaxID=1974746 RepID=A0A2H0LYL2_9BACT|nr:MAG: hypothetical protein COV72_02500 [Candidatus Omnitrophica bacterium CG11_big_fil_rev_8_21_14_0_20_42_13]
MGIIFGGLFFSFGICQESGRRLHSEALSNNETVKLPFETIRFIKRSVGQGDYVQDERSPMEACDTIKKSVCEDNPGFDCKLIDSARIDSPEQFGKCVDGATAGGCFTCTFKCDFIESKLDIANTGEKKDISKDEALKIAQEVCEKEGWEWKDVYVELYEDKWWGIHTNAGVLGGNAFIRIDKETGEVVEKFFNRE